LSYTAKCICGFELVVPQTEKEILEMSGQIEYLKYHVVNCKSPKFQKIEKIGIEECFRGDPEVQNN